MRNHTKSTFHSSLLLHTFARPSEKYHVCPAVSVPKQCRVSALVSASCFRSSSASRSLRWRSWSESSIVTSSSCMQCGNIQIPTATVQGTQGCLHKSCKIIIPGPFWSTMISCCLPFRFIRETAAACDRRFCSSSVSRTRRCDSCSKSLNVTNLEMQLIKRNSCKKCSNQTVDCGHLWAFQVSQDNPR